MTHNEAEDNYLEETFLCHCYTECLLFALQIWQSLNSNAVGLWTFFTDLKSSNFDKALQQFWIGLTTDAQGRQSYITAAKWVQQLC